MNKAFRKLHLIYPICILLMLGVMVGCGDDDPVKTVITDPGEEEPNLAGVIGVYADKDGTNANIVNTGGMVTCYVVHKAVLGVTGSAFALELPSGWTLQGATSPFPLTIGSVFPGQPGISIAYGSCSYGAIHVMTLLLQSPGGAATGHFRVVPNMQWPNDVQVVDCANNLHEGTGDETNVVSP